jgi:putative transposase
MDRMVTTPDGEAREGRVREGRVREGEAPAEPGPGEGEGFDTTELPLETRESRKHPVHGVHAKADLPTIVFLTVCTRNRQPWLATDVVHQTLIEAWHEADAWLVGRYVLMPDHLHLFATPGLGEASFETWVRFWKSRFSRAYAQPDCRWQTDHWDTRVRSAAAYIEKWEYVRLNPVRRGIVSDADQWPYQGELNCLRWDSEE